MADICFSITVSLIQFLYIRLGRVNSQYSMLANLGYNNISIDNHYQEILNDLFLHFSLHSSIMLKMYSIFFNNNFYQRMFDFDNLFLIILEECSLFHISREDYFCIIFGYVFFSLLYIKYFELGLQMSKYNKDKQNSYNGSSLSYKKSNKSRKISYVDKDRFKFLEQKLQ